MSQLLLSHQQLRLDKTPRSDQPVKSLTGKAKEELPTHTDLFLSYSDLCTHTCKRSHYFLAAGSNPSGHTSCSSTSPVNGSVTTTTSNQQQQRTKKKLRKRHPPKSADFAGMMIMQKSYDIGIP